MISTSSNKIDEIVAPDEIETYVSMPSCLLQGCSNDLIIFRADGGNHFTHYGIYEGMFLIFDVSKDFKVYVEVDVTHKTDGTARPRKIKFEDGEVYEIDRVRHCCRAASTKVGGTGLRYTVMICGTETFLFDEENGKWFVEGKKRAVL